MNVTTWGELTDEWVGRNVIVRWESGGDVGGDSLSGMPHERRGELHSDLNYVRGFVLHEADIHGFTSGFPDHALVQEVDGAES